MNDIDLSQFDELQKEQIKQGIKGGVDVSIYAKPEFDRRQMNEIREEPEREKSERL